MSISSIAFRLRAVVFLSLALAMVFGAWSYFNLPAREDPEITVREAVVTTRYNGMSPERVERLITKPLEESVQSIAEVEEVRSTSMDGVSIIHVEVADKYFELDQIWDELAEKIAEAQGQLPTGTQASFIDDDFGDVAVITAALTSKDFSMREVNDYAEYVRDRLYTVAGTKKVDIVGQRAERIYIEIATAALAELGVPLESVVAVLQDQNIVAPGGAIETGFRRFSIEPSGDFENVDEIRNLLLDLGEAGVVRLGDFASVEAGYLDPPQRTAYFEGQSAIIFAIAMESSESVLNYSEDAKVEIGAIAADLPAGISLEIATFQADQVAEAVYGVSLNVLQTLAIVLAVVVLFLGLRTGLIVGSIVPAVMLTTLAVMGVFQLQLERMSLATLVIALGLLVDNGIVIAEDFKRRLEEGVDRRDAVTQTGDELALPLLASSITTILVFMPLMLAQHASGEYTRSISLVILITLLASWLTAMTVTPTLCYWFARTSEEEAGDGWLDRATKNVGALFERLSKRYEVLLRSLLAHRMLFLGIMAALLVLAAGSMAFVPSQFFPSSDRPQILVYVDLPAGTSAAATDQRIAQMADYLGNSGRFPDFESAAAYAGFGGPRFVLSLAPVDPAPNKGFIVVNAKDKKAAAAGIAELRQNFPAAFPDVRARVSGMFLGPSDPNVIQLQVRGPDIDVLRSVGKEMIAMMAEVDGTIDIWSDWENPVATIAIDIDQNRARAAGISSAAVAGTLEGYYSGRRVGNFRDGDDLVPIVMRAPGGERASPARLETAPIFARGSADSALLGQVADIRIGSQPGKIQRENSMRTLTIEARPLALSPEDMVPKMAERLGRLRAELPAGHMIEYDGIIAQSTEGRAALAAYLPACIALGVILLVAQFKGFKRPAVILLTIPLVLIGAAIGLHLMRADFGFMVILGLYSLAGIIINNAIVLIDRIDIERDEEDADGFEAVVSASVRRFRPIIMTTVTTILGLLPLILANDPLFYGMANAIAFGLAVGTLLTLGVVPVGYAIAFGIENANADSDDRTKEAT